MEPKVLEEIRKYYKQEVIEFDTFDGAKPRFSNRGKKRRFLRQAQDTERSRSAVSTLSPSAVLRALSRSVHSRP